MPYKVLANAVKGKGRNSAGIFSLCKRSSFDMKGHERRTKSTVLPLKKNKNHQFLLCLQHSAFLAWERWGVNLIFIVSSPLALSSEAQQLPNRGREKSCVAFCSLFYFWVTELLWETPTYNWSLLKLCWQLFCFFLKVYGWAHSVIFSIVPSPYFLF